MFIVLLALTINNSLGWFTTTTATTTTTAMMALATSNHINPEVINALMMESLRNNLVQACDGERITVHCPKNTQILLENIFYGRLLPSDQLCPPANTEHQLVANEDTNCDVTQARVKILEQCRNKRKCKIMVTPYFFGSDPCPNTSKYLQLSYKCKPVSFNDESFCEGSTMRLSCKQNKRLVIYSAYYGRTVEGKVMHCTPNTPIVRDCVIDVLGQILYYCHAQTECMVSVSDKYFGEAGCEPGVHKYLSLIFMCMSDVIFNQAAIKGNLETMNKIISDLSPTILQKAELTFVKDDELTFHIKDDPNLEYKAIQKSFSSEKNKNADVIMNSLLVSGSEESEEEGAFVIATPNDTTLPSGRPFNAFSIIHDIILIMRILKDNKEKVLLCLLLSLLAGLTILLITCAISGCYRRRTKRKNSKMMGSKDTVRTTKPTELSTLMVNHHSTSAFLDSNSRICFDVGDLSNNKESFLRFTQLTPPRVPQNIHGYS